MATTLFGDASLPPTSANQANIAGMSQGFAGTALGSALPSQTTLAGVLQGLGGGLAATGTGGVSNIQDILTSLGLTQAQIAPILQQMGLSTQEAGIGTQEAGVTATTTGTLPPAAKPFFQTSLNDQIQSIKGKFASLGMSGSSAEQEAITDATNRSSASQFSLAEQLGSVLGGLGTQIAGVGGQIFGGATDLLKTGIGAIATGGSLATTLAELGMQGFQLSLSDITNMASEGLNALGLGGSTFANLTNSQLAADQEYSSSITNMFSAIGSMLPWSGGNRQPGGNRFLPSSLIPANPITG